MEKYIKFTLICMICFISSILLGALVHDFLKNQKNLKINCDDFVTISFLDEKNDIIEAASIKALNII